MKKPKLIVVLGPTGLGKSELVVKIAQKFNGEVISADSRQIYRGLDIGSGKVPRDKTKSYKLKTKNYLYKGIVHHLLDVASPKRIFTVAQYQKLARKKIKEIWQRGKIPILCGGTGFYIQTVVDGIVLPEVKPNTKLRLQLEKKSLIELYKILKQKDPARAKTVDIHNRRRLIRALEIVDAFGRVPPLKRKPLPADILFIGLLKPKNELKKLIKKRVRQWLRQGLLKEISKLLKMKISQKRFQEFGLVYLWALKLHQKEIGRQKFIEGLTKDLLRYAKRQMTWFKRDKRINWIKKPTNSLKLIKKFLQK